MKKIVVVFVLVMALAEARAAYIEFDLFGKGGSGLSPGNENATINGTPGSGREMRPGIVFDDVSRTLAINIGWGSVQRLGEGVVGSDLTGDATAGYIHGPTMSGGTASYAENAGVRYDLSTVQDWYNSASRGSFTGSLTINAGDVPALLNGQFYINIYTSQNPDGEIRGNLVQAVPEPSSVALLSLGGCGLLLLIRRWSK